MHDYSKNEHPELVFQRAYARFLTDYAFRTAVLSGGLLDVQWQVGPEVVKRLRGLDTKRAALFAELLVSNRLATVEEALPNTAALLGPKLAELVQTFHDTTPSTDHRKYPEACSFAHYLLGCLEQEQIGPPCLYDVLVYELSRMQLRFEYDEPFWAEGIKTSEPEFVRALEEGWPLHIHRHPYQTLLSLSYNVMEICEEIAAGRVPAEAQPESSMILLHIGLGGVLYQESINTATAAFLLSVDGGNILNDIVTQLTELFDQRGEQVQASLTDGVRELCLELLKRGVIGFSSSPLI